MSREETDLPPDLASPDVWSELLEAMGPASLLLIVEQRLSSALRRRYSAEDVLQEAFLLAWRDHHRLEWRGLSAFRRWFLTVLDRRILDLAKYESAGKRTGVPSDGSLSAESPEEHALFLSSTTPSRVLARREEADRLRAALAALPSDFRQVAVLRLLERSSVEEVAEALSIGVAAVKYRMSRALAILRELLASERDLTLR